MGEHYEDLYKQTEIKVDFKKMDKILEPFDDYLLEIVNLMRKDIGIDVLNHKLNKRIKK